MYVRHGPNHTKIRSSQKTPLPAAPWSFAGRPDAHGGELRRSLAVARPVPQDRLKFLLPTAQFTGIIIKGTRFLGGDVLFGLCVRSSRMDARDSECKEVLR